MKEYHTLTAEELWAKFEAWKEAQAQQMDQLKTITLLGVKNVWTVKDLSVYLGKTEKTIRNTLQSIPHYKNGTHVVFRRDEIEAWQLGNN